MTIYGATKHESLILFLEQKLIIQDLTPNLSPNLSNLQTYYFALIKVGLRGCRGAA